MSVTNFLQQLRLHGEVTVAAALQPVEISVAPEALELLLEMYQQDVLELPGRPPDFDAAAAYWAAHYLYHCCQLTLLRDATPAEVIGRLQPYNGTITASAIYSADLTLRHLPQLLQLAKGLAPADVLVTTITQLLGNWPYSGVGITLPTTNAEAIAIIAGDTSLQISYVDRLIQHKAVHRIQQEGWQQQLTLAMGAHADYFWPQVELQLKAFNHESTQPTQL